MWEPRNRVVQVRCFGGADELEVVDAPLPTAGRGEVRVRVLASSVQYTDVTIRRHVYPQTMHRQPPFVLGYDVVGEIDQLGDGVGGFQLRDRVADLTVLGSNAAYRTLRADCLTRVPAGVDAAEAATLILSWTTAYQLLHRAARSIGVGLPLIDGDHMARRAPQLRQPLAVQGIGGQRRWDNVFGKDFECDCAKCVTATIAKESLVVLMLEAPLLDSQDSARYRANSHVEPPTFGPTTLLQAENIGDHISPLIRLQDDVGHLPM
jgi:Alcohol dehydrogenase GroES-like domain